MYTLVDADKIFCPCIHKRYLEVWCGVKDHLGNRRNLKIIGPKTASRLLDEAANWDTVVNAYEKAGLTEEDALVQARVARILRASDYDQSTQEPILWTPTK